MEYFISRDSGTSRKSLVKSISNNEVSMEQAKKVMKTYLKKTLFDEQNREQKLRINVTNL